MLTSASAAVPSRSPRCEHLERLLTGDVEQLTRLVFGELLRLAQRQCCMSAVLHAVVVPHREDVLSRASGAGIGG
jgi:hypothetical protein